MKKIKIVSALLLILFLLILPHGSVQAEERETVRVGLYNAQRYSYRNEDGTCAGADIEYAYRIAQNAGLNIEIRLYDSEQEMQKDLDAGNADMLFDFGKTETLKKNYLFSENKVGASALSIFVRTGDRRFKYGDLEQLNGLTFGYEEGNSIKEVIQTWCTGHDLSLNFKTFPSITAVDRALDAGVIDAGVVGENGRQGYNTILTFSPRSYFIMFRGDDKALKNKVDGAMNRILANDPLYEEKLLEKYNITSIGTFGFSEEEEQFITGHPEVSVAVVGGDLPYFSQKKDGSVSGIIPDYYAELARFTGLQFTFHVFGSNTEAIEAVKSGQADILAMFSDGIITAANEGLILTDAYENVDSVLLTRAGTDPDSIRTIAVKERSINNVKQSAGAAMKAEIIPVINARAGFEMLRKKKADAVVCGLPTATWILNQTRSAAYSTSIMSSLQFDLCGASSPDNAALVSLIDKAISATNYKFEGIVEDNTAQQTNWQTVIARITPTQIAAVAGFFIAVILMLVFTLLAQIRHQREKTLLDQERAENEKKQLQLRTIEKNTEERNRFFSDMSHDMRTPLTAILGFSDRIEKETDLRKIREENTKIRTSGELLLNLINDTLTLSKIGSNKLELHPEPVDSAGVFEAVITPVASAAAKKKITFTVDRSHAQPRKILADPLNLQKILLNLLSNAVKYTPEGGHVELILRTEPENADSPDSVIIVRDNGIGMSEDFQKHMFEPFSQEGRTGYGGSGTGLGLSIVKQLVHLMGGTIEVRSGKNEGTEFTLRLHFPEVTESAGNGSPAETEKTEPHSVLNGKKILLCEDNAMNREIAGAILKENGMQVDCAVNGAEGVRKFSESAGGEYAAVLMDLRMPVMDGFEAAENIRKLERADAAAVPIIAISADAFEDDIRRCLESGMNGHVAKPINPKLLLGELAGQLERAAS